MDTIKNAENADNFICEKCDFKCSKQSNYTIHLSTDKHKKICNDIKKMPKHEYICSCGKEYRHHSGLWRHKQSCKPNDILVANLLKQNNDLLLQNQELKVLITEQKEIILEQKEVFIEQIEYNKQLLEIAIEQKELAIEQKELTYEQKCIAREQAIDQHEHNMKILELTQDQKYLAMDQKNLVQEQVEEQQEHNRKILEIAQEQKDLTIEQSEQTKQLMEQIKEKGLGGTIINNTNNTFNLNNFLNVTCKDAMDISELLEYIDQYTIPNKLIEYFENGSHVISMSNVLEAIFDEIPVNKRPINCYDLKREIMHVKDN